MNLLISSLYESLQKHRKNIAFRVGGESFTYLDLLYKVAQIREGIKKQEVSQNIGLLLTYDLYMYASILAIWFEGKSYVPIHPEFPMNKQRKIIEQAAINTLIGSRELPEELRQYTYIDATIDYHAEESFPVDTEMSQVAYILFTSGSTGEPKGVPITYSNLYYFSEAYIDAFGELKSEDEVLQMFELNFDMSVVSYLMPWLYGACVVGLHQKEAKFLQILDLLEANEITVAQLVPSIANLMLPYLDEQIKNKSLRSVFFAGEGLLEKTIAEWRKFVPKARIFNAYGPTESTIVCSYYEVPAEHPKQKNGILSIGKAMKNSILRVGDGDGVSGELLIGGKLLMPHYWENPQKDEEVFTFLDGTRFYKSGDWCEIDEEGDIFYVGRIDFQAKINGFRVELSEIEYFANQFLSGGMSVAIAIKDTVGNDQIVLFVNEKGISDELVGYLKEQLPDYMIPQKIIYLEQYPINSSGKLDRNSLKNYI